jgi:hypothetical protein
MREEEEDRKTRDDEDKKKALNSIQFHFLLWHRRRYLHLHLQILTMATSKITR